MPSLYHYKGYTVAPAGEGKALEVWRDFVTVLPWPWHPDFASGPHAIVNSRAAAIRWINKDRGLMTPVESEWIEAIGYVPITDEMRTLRWLHSQPEFPRGVGFVLVRLKSGKLTAYLVPSWTYGAVMRSKSKGKAFHRLIKGHPEVPVPAGLIE